MVTIRKANENDNEALLEMEKKCPQGTDLVFYWDSSPDYFSRSYPYKDWNMFIAEEDNQVVGAAGCSIKNIMLDGNPYSSLFEYGFLVDPSHRRKGIATKLQEQIEVHGRENRVDILSLGTIENNTPSIRLFTKAGFTLYNTSPMFTLSELDTRSVQSPKSIRGMEVDDVERVSVLVNEAHQGYDFFTPFDESSFLEYVRRLPYFGLNDIYVYEEQGEVEACLGLWNYDEVMRLIVLSFGESYSSQFVEQGLPVPEVPFKSSRWGLTMVGYSDTDYVEELLKHVVNLCVENDVRSLFVGLDVDDPFVGVVSGYNHRKMMCNFFVKRLMADALVDSGQRKMYIDTIDL